MNVANAWESLGIAPTSDVRAVKKAYSNMSKKYHPEEMPDEFRTLHEAYKAALKDAQSRQNQPDLLSPAEQHSRPKEKALDFSAMEQVPKPHQETFNFSALKGKQQPPAVKSATSQEELLRFDDLLEQGNRQERERREQCIQRVLQDMEGLCRGWLVRKKQLKWRSYLKTKEFLHAQFMPEFIERFVAFLEKQGSLPNIVWAEIFHAYFVNSENVIEYKYEYSDLYDYLFIEGNDGGYVKCRQKFYKRGQKINTIFALLLFGFPIALGIVIRYGWWLLVLPLFVLYLVGLWKAQLLKTYKGILGGTAFTAFFAFFPAFVFNPSVDSSFHNFMNGTVLTRVLYFYIIPAFMVCFIIRFFLSWLRGKK